MALGLNLGYSNAVGGLIPTYTNDSPSIGIESITGFNGDTGTLYIDLNDTVAGNDRITVMLSDGTNNNRIFIQKRASQSRYRILAQTGGGTNEIWDGFLSCWATGDMRIAITYDNTTGTVKFFNNGMLLAEIASFTLATLTQVDLGQLLGGSLPFTGTFNQLKFYTPALTDAQSVNLTKGVEILSGITKDTAKLGYAFLGQSNSVGQAVATPSYANSAKMFLLNNAMSLGAYSDPYASPTSAKVTALSDTSGNYEVGYAGYFANTLAGSTGSDVVVSPANLSGTSFEGSTPTWALSTSTYRTSGTKIVGMMATATACVNQMQLIKQHMNIDGIIWGQGEGDVVNGTTQVAYTAHLTALIDVIRGAVGGSIPWYNCSFPANDANWAGGQSKWDAIDDAQIAVASAMSNVNYITGNDISGDSGDEVHYALAGYTSVGANIAGSL